MDAYGLDSAMFMFCLDEMLRRSQISTTSALNWATPKILQLNQNTTLYTLFETIVDRSVDFVRASVAQRATHEGSMPLDATLDLTPAPEPEGVVAMVSAAPSNTVDEPSPSEVAPASSASEELEEVDYSEDVEVSASSKRQRRDPDAEDGEGAGAGGDATAAGEASASSGKGGDVAMDDEEEHKTSQDPLWLTTEAVKTAVGNVRTVYASLLSTLSKGIATAQQQPHGPGNALWSVVAHSLILKTLRAVHGAERNLAHTYQQPVLLSDVSHKVVLYLEGSGALKEIWNDHFKL